MTGTTEFENRVGLEEDRYDNGGAPSWGMFLVGVAVTVAAAFYVGFMRPASQQLSYLQRQINRMERSVRELTDAKDAAGRANDLLTQLSQQGNWSSRPAWRSTTFNDYIDNSTPKWPACSTCASRLKSSPNCGRWPCVKQNRPPGPRCVVVAGKLARSIARCLPVDGRSTGTHRCTVASGVSAH